MEYYLSGRGRRRRIFQIAGSSWSYNEEQIALDEELVRQWLDEMEDYLADSRLLLGTQDGELRVGEP